MRPCLARVRGRYIVPRPVTLAQLSDLLECTLAEARVLLHASRFPHAYVDWEGQWRVPVPDIAAYIRSRNEVAGFPAPLGAQTPKTIGWSRVVPRRSAPVAQARDKVAYGGGKRKSRGLR